MSQPPKEGDSSGPSARKSNTWVFILIAVGGMAALWVIFKFIGGCLVRALLLLAVLALIAFLIYSFVRC